MIQVQPVQHKYSPEQPRDPEGRFSEGGVAPVSHQPRLSTELDPSTEARALDMLTRGGKTLDLHSQPVRVAAKVQGMNGMADVITADPTKMAVFERTFGKHGREALEQQIRTDVSRWARTASDNDAQAIAMQRAAMDMFGTRPDGYAPLLTMNRHVGQGERGTEFGSLAKEVDQAYARYGAWDRTLLGAMYANTQALLKEHGLDHLTLYRSMGWQSGHEPAWASHAKDGGAIDVPMQPLASWAATKTQAREFNGSLVDRPGWTGVVLSTNVPASRIIATPFTGFGALMEHEFVTADTPGDMLVHKFGK